VLEVREEIVMSLLNSFHSIDQIMLIEDRERAYQIVKRGDHDGARVDCAYTPEGDRIKLTNGSLSDFKARDSGSFWFESSKEKLAALEREMGQLAVTNAAQKRLREHESRLRTLRESHAAAETALSSMRAKFDSISQLKENSTEDYERKQAALARRVSVAQSKLGEAQQALEQRHEARRQIDKENEAERVRVATRKAEMQANLCNFDLQIARSSQKKRDLISKKNMLDREVATRIDAMLSGKENSGKENCRGKGEEPGLSQTSGNLLRLPDKYRKLVEAPRSLVDVLGDKAAINEHIRTRDKMRSQSDIRNDISVLMKERSVHAKIKNKFSMAISETHAACMKRQTKRDEIKDIKTAEASALFAEYTARAGYEGTLKFDHAQGLLDLRMKVHNASVAGSKSTLSGGERSFAGVCFLLSLWRSFQCPVKILDEFDVFMDPLNRKAAIRSLLEFFKENEMQAILITPLSTDDLRSCDVDIKVLTKEE
ncbi:structural maintenance of chromosomes protein 6, partial [Pancytospora philotis]